MPLKDQIPILDDRRYEDLVEEIRTRIPRYTPEWSDLNDNDPGMAVVQLFAWMTDMLMYRLGRVPEANYIKFLQLVGIELTPAQPASALVSFPVKSTATSSIVDVPLNTQVSAEDPDGEGPIVFETERALVALRAALARVQVSDGFSVQDRTAENADSTTSFEPFGSVAGPDGALLIGFSDPDPFPETELALAVLVASAAAPGAVTCSGSSSRSLAPATLAWEYWDGTDWRTLTLLDDESLAFTRSGFVRLQMPAAGSLQAGPMLEVADSLYWIRARVERSEYESVPRILTVRSNTVEVLQAQSVADEVLGGSDGSPNQVLALENAPLLEETLRLEVDEGSGFESWTEVSDFLGSGPFDKHFAVNRTTGEVRFGDGRNGAIPAGNRARRGSNIVARSYRFGGGARGNVAAGSLVTLVNTIRGIDTAGVTNESAAAGGVDEQSLDDAILRAPSAIQSRGRAVTTEDYEELARQAGAARALALPLHHPDFPSIDVPGAVTVIVVPNGEETPPVPSEATLRSVCARLDGARSVTAELHVVPPRYRRVEVRAELLLEDDADRSAILLAASEAVETFLHPLRGGDDGDGWPFGGTIYFSRVYQLLLVSGVLAVETMQLTLDGDRVDDCRDVPLCPGELPYCTDPEISVRYVYEESAR